MRISRPTLKPVLRQGDPSDTPATMRVTSGYGPRGGGFHAALDIGNYVAGDNLVACGDGVVLAAGYLGRPWSDPKPSDAWWFAQPAGPAAGQRGGLYGPPSKWEGPVWGGLQLILDLGGGYVAGYAHCDRLTVSAGDRVALGGPVGILGDTGSAHQQPHLHFGIRYDGALGNGQGGWVDPWPLINGAAHPHQEDVDDVKISGKFLRHVANRRGALSSGSNFRAGVVAGDDTPLAVFPAGTAVIPTIVTEGRAFGTAPDRLEWYGCWNFVSGPQAAAAGSTITGWLFGYYHSSVLPRTADGSAVNLEPIEETGGHTAAELDLAKRAGFTAGRDKAAAAAKAVQP